MTDERADAVPEDVLALAAERDERRAERDFAAADALRDRIVVLGYQVIDSPEGFRVEALAPAEPRRLAPAEVPSLLDQPAAFDLSVQWVAQGWPEDVVRGIESFRRHQGSRTVQHVVVDAADTDPAFWPDGVELVALDADHGWGADRNCGMRRAAGDLVLVVDGSIEATGDVFGPLEVALAEPSVGVAGPFGIVTPDLRHFHESAGPEVDAVEGYLMAFRRDVFGKVGLFDEKFRFYRSADIELSFRIKDAGLRAVVVDVPVEKHQHRMWSNTPEAERDRLSKRNFYRFLERFRDRSDLCVAPGPDHGR